MSNVQVNQLTMQFGDVTALNNVTLSFEENKIYGLLGRNGAGKSTLINVITNKIFPTKGFVSIDGKLSVENDTVLQNIYCMSEKSLYPPNMKVRDILKWTKEFYPNFDMEYANKLAEKFSLNTKKSVKQLSTGYSSIFKIVVALACNAPIIFLDEPVLGLDANHRELFYKLLIEDYSENPRTIVISTHLIDEVADIIEQVIIIKDGSVIMDDSAEKVKTMGYSVSGKASDIDMFLSDKKALAVDTLGGLKTAYMMGNHAEHISSELEISALDLEKLFIQLTNA